MITHPLLKKVLLSCLREGGQIIRRGFRKKISIRKKGPVSLVTEIDTAAEKKIVSIIRKNFPAHRILTEESPPYKGAPAYRWIIDPLDGTTNFAHGLTNCCVSVGLECEGKIILGGIYNPLTEELFSAEQSKGAFLNGKRIRVSKTKRLIDSLIVTGFPYDRIERAAYYLKFVKPMMEKSQGLRRFGAAAMDMAYVACGRFDAFWEFRLNPWDIAAGTLIVKEAGGTVSDFHGKPLNIDHPKQTLASNGLIHGGVVALFRKVL